MRSFHEFCQHQKDILIILAMFLSFFTFIDASTPETSLFTFIVHVWPETKQMWQVRCLRVGKVAQRNTKASVVTQRSFRTSIHRYMFLATSNSLAKLSTRVIFQVLMCLRCPSLITSWKIQQPKR